VTPLNKEQLLYQEVMTGFYDALAHKGAGDWLGWLREHGYHMATELDITDPDGNWSFLVSIDGRFWHKMHQAYIDGEFVRAIDEGHAYFGDMEEAVAMVTEGL
jgi:hypothetical protein